MPDLFEYGDDQFDQQDLVETAYRLMMIVLSLHGQPEQAMFQHQHYVGNLNIWFGNEAEPSLAMDDLFHKIQRREDLRSLLKRYSPKHHSIPNPPKGPPFQVPDKRTSLLGRDQVISELAEGLRQPPNIYSLVGMGGVGKSSLAIFVGHDLRSEYVDGVLWANMAVSEPHSILQSWAKALDADFNSLPDVAARANAFRTLTGNKRILLILDNVLDAGAVEFLLPNSSRADVLLTTRDLDVASVLNSKIVRLEPLPRESSRDLLTHLIGKERANKEAVALENILNFLDNLPLAIEIIGQRLRSRPQQKLAEFVSILSDVSARNRLDSLHIKDHAVRVAFEQSWERLIARQQEIFASLGVFGQRPFTADALAYVAELELYQASHDLADLFALSLLTEYDSNHYRLHALLADFALEKLSGTLDEDRCFRRMVDYYLGFARDHVKSIPILESEWDQVMNGFSTAYHRQYWLSVLDYAQVLEPAWFMLGRFQEAHTGFSWACEAAAALNDRTLLAWGLCQRGRTFVEQNNTKDAQSPLNQSLEIFIELGDIKGIATAKHYLGRSAVVQDNYLAAELLLGESVFHYQQLGDNAGVAEALYILEDIPYYAANLDVAQWFAENALRIYADIHNMVGVIRCYGQLANIAFKRSLYADAEQYCRKALVICDNIHEQAERAIILYNLADACLFQDKFDLAIKAIEDSLHLLRKMGDHLMEARALRQRADTYLALGNCDLALLSCQQSLALFRGLQHKKNIARALLQQFRIYVACGQHHLALESCSGTVFQELGDDSSALREAYEDLKNNLAQT